MEVLKVEAGDYYDKLAEKVFMEAIKIAGGLRKLIEYRNLTWLPSLAEAVYVVVLKNEAALTNKEIAAKLGITEQTVANILRAEAEEVEKWLKGELVEVDEHKAGALAKLAYEKMKKEEESAGENPS